MTKQNKSVTQNTKRKNFGEFTNLYSLSKTLRFELKPVKATKTILEVERKDRENFKKDRKIAKNYQKLKGILNELHQEFIQDVMREFSFQEKEIKEFEERYLEALNFKEKDNYKKRTQLKNAYEKVAKKLAGKIATAFGKYNQEKYGVKFTKKNLTGENVFDILEGKYKGDKKILGIIHTFKFKPTKEEKKQGKEAVNFSTYLGGFNQNRENFYKGEMKAGQFATRTIENLIQFLKNKKLFIDKYKDNYQKIGFSQEQVEIFNLNYFNNLFLQEGLDVYNGILGAKKGEKNTENDGLNQKINLFKQKEKTRCKANGEKFNKSDYPIFKELYKQIGSIKKDNDVYVEIKSDEELVNVLQSLPEKTANTLREVQKFYENFFDKIFNDEFDLDKIYLPKSVGTHFSHLAFSDWSKLAFVFNKRWRNEKVKIKEGEDVNVQSRSLADIKKRMEEILEMDGGVSFGKTYCQKVGLEKEARTIEDVWSGFWKIIQYHINSQFIGGEKEVFDKEKKDDKTEKIQTIDDLQEEYLQATEMYRERMVESEEGLNDGEEKEIKTKLKNYLDRIKDIERIARYFDLRKHFDDIDEASKDGDFYFIYQELLQDISEAKINDHYNEIRNYLTKANVVDDKFKLNFNDGQTLSGWDLNKETEKFSLIFKRKVDGGVEYYLGIINKEKNKTIFDKKKHPEIFTENSEFEKMEYKLFPSPSKMLPKIAFTKNKEGERIKPVFLDENAGKEIAQIKKEFALFQDAKKEDKNKWSDEFDRKKLNKLIDYYKLVLEKHPEKYMQTFNFVFKSSAKYKNLGEFNDDVARQNYVTKFVSVDKDYIDQKVESGELYLFKIHNKDWNLTKAGDTKKQSKKNLHTIYFEELFSEKNIAEPVFKLSGGAEVFFRDAIEKKKQKKKKDKKGKEILEKFRFTKNKILFHVPITINYGKPSINQGQFNQKINEFIADNSRSVNILGIDRGEKHLLYYSLVDNNGKIIKSGSLNEINGVDYHEKLDKAEKERQEARKSWQKINQIKNLKAGYISQVIKKIVDLAIENNAIIVLEDLNFGFKSFRQKIEKNVYQQFEKALIDKLGFVTDKEKLNHRQAPQLSAPFESFEKMGKQTGIVFYVLATNTSKVCPQCQWKKNIFPHYSTKKSIAENLQKQYKMKMYWRENENRFEFEYKGDGDKEFSSIFSNVDRVRYDKRANNNQGGYVIYQIDSTTKEKDGRNIKEKSITNLLKELLLEKFEIDNLEGELLVKLSEKSPDVSKETIKDFFGLLNSILNIRNSMTDTEEDYIQCPACGFDTRKENKIGIKNGDDNGAYNIALRGRFLIERIKKAKKEDKKPNLTFSNNDYFQWVREFVK